MTTEYKVPCGRVMGHGELCREGWPCEGCTEIRRLREAIDPLRMIINEHKPGSRADADFKDRYMPDVPGVRTRSDKPGDENLDHGNIRVEIRYSGEWWRADIPLCYPATGKALFLEEAAIKAFRMSLKGMMAR